MRRRVQVAVVILVVALISAVGVIGVGRVREAAARMRCHNNLKSIVIALANYESTYGHFPAGTVPGTSLPPENRLGWLVDIWPFMESGPRLQFDKAKAWDAEGNCPPYCFAMKDKREYELPKRVEVIGDVKAFLCPSNLARNGPLLPCPTHYVGLSGIGPDAASLPVSDHRAGLFGYDRKTSPADITDGRSTTMALAEVTDGGPWSAGGRATIRGVDPDGAPYLGGGGQFAGFHRGGGSFSWSRPIVTNVAFVDGSVRGLTAAIAPEVFEALATIAGGEAVEVIPEG